MLRGYGVCFTARTIRTEEAEAEQQTDPPGQSESLGPPASRCSQTWTRAGQISMPLGREIRLNPETEEIIGDATAIRMLGNAMRIPWHL